MLLQKPLSIRVKGHTPSVQLFKRCVRVCVCVCVCAFIVIKSYLIAQSSSVILAILCYSHWFSQGGIVGALLRKLLIRRNNGDVFSLQFSFTPSSPCAFPSASLPFSR